MFEERMSDDPERSPSGSPIYRHKERERSFEPAVGGGEHAEAVERHFEQHVGPIDSVFHEIISDLVHVDVHLIRPAAERDHWVLFTTGMSDREMTMPNDAPFPSRAELVVSLPADWKLDQASFEDERWYWPIRGLKFLARLPHEYRTWLGPGHTIPNGDPPKPFEGCAGFCCFMVLPTMLFPEDQRIVTTPSGDSIALYAVLPLHLPEMSLKLNKGSEALLDELDRADVGEVIDPNRPSAVRKKLFGLF